MKPIALCSECNVSLVEAKDEKDHPTYYCVACDKTTCRTPKEKIRLHSLGLICLLDKILMNPIGFVCSVLIASTIILYLCGALLELTNSVKPTTKAVTKEIKEEDKVKDFFLYIEDPEIATRSLDELIKDLKRAAVVKGYQFIVIKKDYKYLFFVVRTTKKFMSSFNCDKHEPNWLHYRLSIPKDLENVQ